MSSAAIEGSLLQVRLLPHGSSFRCRLGETLVQAQLRLGRKDIPYGCTHGGCGACRVTIVSGSFRVVARMSRDFISESDERRGMVLACCVTPESQVEVRILGR